MHNANHPFAGDIDLSAFDDDFGDAPVETREFADVPDGKYQVQVDKVELVAAKSSGNPMLKWCLRILGPTHAGRLLWRNNVITRENLRWLKTDLHLCGVELTRLSELRNRLPELLDISLEVTKKTRGDFANVYFNKVITPSQHAGGGSYGDDEIPF